MDRFTSEHKSVHFAMNDSAVLLIAVGIESFIVGHSTRESVEAG
jgi:hypothetical protein